MYSRFIHKPYQNFLPNATTLSYEKGNFFRKGTIKKPSLVNFLGKVGPTRAHASFIGLDVTEGSMYDSGRRIRRQIVFTTSDLPARFDYPSAPVSIIINKRGKGGQNDGGGIAE